MTAVARLLVLLCIASPARAFGDDSCESAKLEEQLKAGVAPSQDLIRACRDWIVLQKVADHCQRHRLPVEAITALIGYSVLFDWPAAEGRHRQLIGLLKGQAPNQRAAMFELAYAEYLRVSNPAARCLAGRVMVEYADVLGAAADADSHEQALRLLREQFFGKRLSGCDPELDQRARAMEVRLGRELDGPTRSAESHRGLAFGELRREQPDLSLFLRRLTAAYNELPGRRGRSALLRSAVEELVKIGRPTWAILVLRSYRMDPQHDALAARLRPHVASLNVVVLEPDAQLLLDGQPIRQSEDRPLDPGVSGQLRLYRLEVRGRGGEVMVLTLRLGAADRCALKIQLSQYANLMALARQAGQERRFQQAHQHLDRLAQSALVSEGCGSPLALMAEVQLLRARLFLAQQLPVAAEAALTSVSDLPERLPLLDEIERTIVVLKVITVPTETEVTVDGKQTVKEGLYRVWRGDPGRHQLVAGGRVKTRCQLEPGWRRRLRLQLTDGPSPPDPRLYKISLGLGLGVGALAIPGGVLVGVERVETCDYPQCAESFNLRPAGVALLAIGGAFALGGAIGLIVHRVQQARVDAVGSVPCQLETLSPSTEAE